MKNKDKVANESRTFAKKFAKVSSAKKQYKPSLVTYKKK